MKLTSVAKVVAVLVFAFGVIAFGSAQLKSSKEKPRSFVMTCVITRSENGGPAVVTGLSVKTVGADGQSKRIIVRRPGDGYIKQIGVSFVDKTARYGLEDGRLECWGTSDVELERDKTASTADWITKSPGYVGTESLAGLKVYTTHYDEGDEWMESAYSPLTRGTPLRFRRHFRNVEENEEAVSVDFRDVSPDEIKPPDLPISFETAKWLENGFASNPENADTVKRLIEDREAVTAKLRAMGRIK